MGVANELRVVGAIVREARQHGQPNWILCYLLAYSSCYLLYTGRVFSFVFANWLTNAQRTFSQPRQPPISFSLSTRF